MAEKFIGYTCSLNGHYFGNELFETEEEAKKMALITLGNTNDEVAFEDVFGVMFDDKINLSKIDKIFIGETYEYEPEIDGRELVEILESDYLQTTCTGEERPWLDSLTPQELDELGDVVTNCVKKWLEETNNDVPDGFIGDMKEVFLH